MTSIACWSLSKNENMIGFVKYLLLYSTLCLRYNRCTIIAISYNIYAKVLINMKQSIWISILFHLSFPTDLSLSLPKTISFHLIHKSWTHAIGKWEYMSALKILKIFELISVFVSFILFKSVVLNLFLSRLPLVIVLCFKTPWN